MKLLKFDDEAQMQSVLTGTPFTPFGTVTVRGDLGDPGVFEDRGEVDADGNPVMTVITAPKPWPGYYAELDVETLPRELAGYAA